MVPSSHTGAVSGRLVFRYGHEHRSAVDLYGIDLNAIRRDEPSCHMRQIVGVDIEGLGDAFQKAAGHPFLAIHVVSLTVIEP